MNADDNHFTAIIYYLYKKSAIERFGEEITQDYFDLSEQKLFRCSKDKNNESDCGDVVVMGQKIMQYAN